MIMPKSKVSIGAIQGVNRPGAMGFMHRRFAGVSRLDRVRKKQQRQTHNLFPYRGTVSPSLWT